MNIQRQYHLRNKQENAALCLQDGLFVVGIGPNVRYFVHTGLRPRQHKFCNKCMDAGFAVDVFAVGSASLTPLAHGHVQPDDNVVAAVPEIIGSANVYLIPIDSATDLEGIVWDMFVRENDLNNVDDDWPKPTAKKKPDIELRNRQMFYCARHYPQHFMNYYTQVNLLTVGRKYVGVC